MIDTENGELVSASLVQGDECARSNTAADYVTTSRVTKCDVSIVFLGDISKLTK